MLKINKINRTPFYHQSPAAFAMTSFGTNTFRVDTRGGNVLLLPGCSRTSPSFSQWKKRQHYSQERL